MENQPSNEKKTNFDYLKESLYYLGFGDKVNASLEGAIKEGKLDIKIVVSSLFDRPDSKKDDNLTKDYVNYELTFKKGTETDNYFFNSYSAKLVTPQAEERIQNFYIDKGKGITAKEAYNLLSGRAVQKTLIKKDGEKYLAFLQYDIKSPKDEKGNYLFQKFHENYGFKIDKALDTYPISFETPEKKLELIKSLEKGNAQFVKLTTGQHLFAVADPQYKDIKFLDNQNKNVRVEKIGQTQKISVSRGMKNKM
jgi:hypothetical protein